MVRELWTVEQQAQGGVQAQGRQQLAALQAGVAVGLIPQPLLFASARTDVCALNSGLT